MEDCSHLLDKPLKFSFKFLTNLRIFLACRKSFVHIIWKLYIAAPLSTVAWARLIVLCNVYVPEEAKLLHKVHCTLVLPNAGFANRGFFRTKSFSTEKFNMQMFAVVYCT